MAPGSRTARPSLLDRLDLELAARAESELAGLDAQGVIGRFPKTWVLPRADRDAWIIGVLGIRGIKVDREMVRSIIQDGSDPRCSRQERVFIAGLDRALDRILGRGRCGDLPSGRFAVDLFETVTRGLPRFTNNHLRRDLPWDAQRHVDYPKPDALVGMLERLSPEQFYREMPAIYEATHPVRLGFRAMWRLARISPFPDFNLMFAFLFMNAFHVSAGYPLLTPQASDRTLLEAIVAGCVPRKIVQFESRMLDVVR